MTVRTKLLALRGAFGVAALSLLIGCDAGLVGSDGAQGSRQATSGGDDRCRVLLVDFSEAGVSLPLGTQVTLGDEGCVTYSGGEVCTVLADEGAWAMVVSTHLGACTEETEEAQPEPEPEEACGPEPHYQLVDGRCLPSCGRAMGDAALAKTGSDEAYLSFGDCLGAHPSSPCDEAKGHHRVETWDCGMTCCIYPEGDGGQE